MTLNQKLTATLLAAGIAGTVTASTSTKLNESDSPQRHIVTPRPNILCIADEVQLPPMSDGKVFPLCKTAIHHTTYRDRTIVTIKRGNTTQIMGYLWSHLGDMTCTVPCEYNDKTRIEKTLQENKVPEPYNWMVK